MSVALTVLLFLGNANPGRRYAWPGLKRVPGLRPWRLRVYFQDQTINNPTQNSLPWFKKSKKTTKKAEGLRFFIAQAQGAASDAALGAEVRPKNMPERRERNGQKIRQKKRIK